MMKRFFTVILIAFVSISSLSSCLHLHKWEIDQSTSTATCTQDGEATYICSGCNETKVDVAPKGHVERVAEAVDPSCVENGYTEGTECVFCKTVMSGRQVINPTGHKYSDENDESCNACDFKREINNFFIRGLAAAPALGENGKRLFGFINPDGEFVIDPIFEAVAPDYFVLDESALVRKDGKWGYIDISGNFICEPSFNYAEQFKRDGFAAVCAINKWGIIDKTGTFIVEPVFDSFPGISDSEFCFNELGLITVEVSGKFGFVNRSGEIIVPPELDIVWQFDRDGIAIVHGNAGYGIVGKEGYIISPQFGAIGSFSDNGLAYAKSNQSIFGYIDKTGAWVIEPSFASAKEFSSDGLAIVMIDDLYGYIDSTGNFVIKPEYKSATPFDKNGLALVTVSLGEGTKYGYIDRNGEWVINPLYDSLGEFAENGLATVTVERQEGFINTDGALVIEPQFDSVSSFGKNGLAVVKSGEKFGLINSEGSYVVEPQYDKISSFNEYGLAKVELKRKYGYIDQTGKTVVAPEYDLIYEFDSNGIANVRKDWKIGCINTKGEVIFDAIADYAIAFNESGVALVSVDQKYGCINQRGEYVTEPVYDSLDLSTDGYVMTTMKKDSGELMQIIRLSDQKVIYSLTVAA